MKWSKVNKEAIKQVYNINPDKGIYLLNFSPRPNISEDAIIDCEVLSVKVNKIPDTVELKQYLYNLQSEYDKSDEVNYFLLEGKKCWLNKSDRVGLINSINIQKDSGALVTNLWLNGTSYPVSIDYALDFLRQLELYAIACNNITQIHIAEISQINDRDALFMYNITTGYPSPIEFDNTQIIKV